MLVLFKAKDKTELKPFSDYFFCDQSGAALAVNHLEGILVQLPVSVFLNRK